MGLRKLPPRITPAEADAAYASAQKVVEAHRRLAAFMHAGQTLAEIDAHVGKVLDELDCKSCFLHYRVGKLPPFPSHACLSVNDCVVHGNAGYYLHPLKPGDLLKLDIGVRHRGWIGDAGWTYSVGPPSPAVRKLMDCGKESLRLGIEQLRPGNRYLDWAKAVQQHVEKKCGFRLIRGLGGHGIGRYKDDRDRGLHLPPYVSNLPPSYLNEWPDATLSCEPGNLVAVEPMIALTTGATEQRKNEWPVFTSDGSLSVHHEHDVLITEKGPRILSEGMEDLPDVIRA